MAEEKLIGKVTHYYNKAMVVIVDLKSPIGIGDTIKIKRGDEEFEQKIESMQIEHKAVQKGKRGDELAIKVEQPAKEGAEIYKVKE